MSKIKKFSDFFAIFGAFSALMYLVMQFLPFEYLPEDELTEESVSILSKLKAFLSPELENDYLVFLVMLLLFTLCFVLARVIPRLPTLHAVLSLLPLGWSFFMFDYIHLLYTGNDLTEKFKDYPLLYPVCAILYAAGAFADCLIADRKSGTRRAPRATLIATALSAILSLMVFFFALPLSKVSSEEVFFLQKAVAMAWEAKEVFLPYLWIALMYLLLCVIDVFLGNLFFLDLIASAIPGIYVLLYWHSDELPVFGAGIAILAAALFLFRLLLTLFADPSVAPKTVRATLSETVARVKESSTRLVSKIKRK